MNDQDSWPDGLDEEAAELAETQKALAAERDARDAALSNDSISVEEQRERDYERLGFMLAWWAEDNDVPPLDTISDLANQVCGLIQHQRLLKEHGMPDGMMSTSVVLDQQSGPLVVAALQILGTMHSHLRPEIETLLVTIHDALPVMTDEEKEAYLAAHTSLSRAQFEEAKEAFAAQGIPVISLDELQGDEEDERDSFDSGLN